MIRSATLQDISAIANIDRLSFSGNKPEGVAEKWIATNFARGDQYQYFVFEKENQIAGFIAWEVKNGFAREVPLLELEKFAVHPDFRGQGIASTLIDETFLIMKNWIRVVQPQAKEFRVMVWCLKGNEKALQLYKKLCNDGVKGERSVFSIDEVLLRGTYQL
jgi:ribosomal protein S18 acetylase RimI-like enzyme